jgi:hypothetical protein
MKIDKRSEGASDTLMNIAAAASIALIIGAYSLADWFERGDAALYMANLPAVRNAMDARTFCKAPTGTEVLHMRVDRSTETGYHCAFYDNVGYGRAPVAVKK